MTQSSQSSFGLPMFQKLEKQLKAAFLISKIGKESWLLGTTHCDGI
ncbi:hypothetical protein JCM19233_1358 [Vibrio astriarenae]|nr:hypothetical protein JCM19233_1358 [Vibrio sp. C7]